MNPEEIVTSLELSIQLKEKGYPQDGSIWVWSFDTYYKDVKPKLILRKEIPYPLVGRHKKIIDAPLGDELDWKLPSKILYKGETWYLGIFKDEQDGETWYFVKYHQNYNSTLILKGDKIPANAKAKMWLWLIDNKRISFEENK